MITFQQFLNEKFYGFKSKGSNSPNMLMAKKVSPAKPTSLKFTSVYKSKKEDHI
jgi:hypothetical protein